ncbi:EI24 domain-containing protein [Microbacteriaceae bacterium VKM Ac-2855]|nr:EI24 domain-containing protein [Microbacteriaceae bacterium VKM Ac-2855]
MWGRSPKLMLWGAIPPLVVGAVFVAGFVVLITNLTGLAAAVTPFADDWAPPWAETTRILAGIALLAAAGVLLIALFAAVTLAVGDPFYERIWRRVETDLGGVPDEVETAFWPGVRRAVRDGIVLVATSLLIAILVFAIGFVPVVGQIAGIVAGALVGGRTLAIELSGFAGDARGLSLRERRRLLASRRGLSLGFGIAVYLTFLIPGGAVVTTPAATAGATLLLRELRGEETGVARASDLAAAPPRR